MQLTWLDNNSWLIKIAQKTILLDPWLREDLVFGGQTWLFRGIKQTYPEIPANIDLILLSQGLEDHAHVPTLKQLDHQIPVVASPNGAKVVKELGYSQITALNPGETYILDDNVEITAFSGSQIGPTLTENAYVLKNRMTQHTLYYEPHGNHCSDLDKIAPVDVILTPIVEFSLLKIAPILKGQENTLKLCQRLHPQFILPTAGAKETEYKGVLTYLLREVGTVERFREMLKENHLTTQVIQPQPYQPVELSLRQSVLS